MPILLWYSQIFGRRINRNHYQEAGYPFMDQLRTTDIRELKAYDIMQTNVFMATEDMSLWELARLFSQKRVTGVPVIGKGGGVVGVVSKTDLVRLNASNTGEPKSDEATFFKVTGGDLNDLSSEIDLEDLKSCPTKKVKDIMTPWIIAALPETPITEVAWTMVDESIHRVLIVDQQKQLKGIITTVDIVRAVAQCVKKT